MTGVAPDGIRFAAVPLVAGTVALPISPPLAIGLFALAGGVLWFYRDPDRAPPEEGVVAPADGTVQVVRTTPEGRVRVGVFMNVWDVHVNRAPFPGTVESVEHVPGAHRPAFTKESDRNERVHVDWSTPSGDARVTLIAGAFARRIHPWLSPGDRYDRGARIGHISFGSRADVVLPEGLDVEDLTVDRGQSVVAGETPLVDPAALDEDDPGDRPEG